MRHVTIGNAVITLDTRTGRYGLVERDDSSTTLRSSVGPASESRVPGPGRNGIDHSSVGEEGLKSWLSPAESFQPAPHARDLPGCDVRNIPRPSIADVASTAIDILWAATLLKLASIEGIEHAIQGLRRKHRGRAGKVSFDLVREVEIYKRACVYFYDPRDRCMLNALSLIRFLARRGCFPRWCIGVQVRPFAAHCWVEDEQFVYGDSLGNCRGFRPILVV